MKIRNGFVSNSSSSSYVVIGMRFTNEELISKFGDNHDWTQYSECGCLYGDDGYSYVGYIALLDEDEQFSYNVSEINEKSLMVERVLEFNSNEIEIFEVTTYR
jgi:hypothetical protein